MFIYYIPTCFALGCTAKSDNSCLYPVISLTEWSAKCISKVNKPARFYRSLLSEGTKRVQDAPERRSQTCTSETCPRREPIQHNDILSLKRKESLVEKKIVTPNRVTYFSQLLIQVHPLHRQIGFDHFLCVCLIFTFFS